MTLKIVDQVEETKKLLESGEHLLPKLKDESHIKTGKAPSGNHHWAPGAIYENPNLKNEK